MSVRDELEEAYDYDPNCIINPPPDPISKTVITSKLTMNTLQPQLKVENLKCIRVENWDSFIAEVYGNDKHYSFQQQNGCMERGIVEFDVDEFIEYEEAEDFDDANDTDIDYSLNGETYAISLELWLTTKPENTRKYFKSDFENDLFWTRHFYPSFDQLINDLRNKKLISDGKYCIIVDW